MSWRGREAYSHLPQRMLDPFPCPCPLEMDSTGQHSSHDSQPGGVSCHAPESRPVVPLHLHTQVRLRLHRECAFD